MPEEARGRTCPPRAAAKEQQVELTRGRRGQLTDRAECVEVPVVPAVGHERRLDPTQTLVRRRRVDRTVDELQVGHAPFARLHPRKIVIEPRNLRQLPLDPLGYLDGKLLVIDVG